MVHQLLFEHVAVNVADPVAVAAWYCEHLGMRVVRQGEAPVHMHFLADAGGRVVLEIYCSPPALVPDYTAQDPQVLHLAFAAADVAAARQRLLTAGATAFSGITTTAAGDLLAMLRDPWGLALQLTQRASRMVG
jgi:glyoxylase I family protein